MIKRSILLILSMLISVGFVFAIVTVANTAGTAFALTNESVANVQYNFTVNNSAVAANITEVNVTIPTGFIFIDQSNLTGGNPIFSNSSSSLNWSDESLVANFTNMSFAFNMTSSSTPGYYNVTIITKFANGTVNDTTNISLNVNDTAAPTLVEFVDPGVTGTGNWSLTSLPVNLSVTDLGTVNVINITLHNSTQNIINSSRNITNGTNAYWNFTEVSDGIYYINATVNDTNNNQNNTVPTITILLDTINPEITFSCTPSSPSTADSVTCTCASTDGGSGIANTTMTPSTATSGSNNWPNDRGDHTVYCSTVDYAGNSNVTSVTYTVSDSSGIGSGSGGASYTKTYVATDAQFKEGYTKEVKKNEKIKVKVDGIIHNVGLTGLTTTSATVSVFSTPQEATLNIGDERKFDVNDDDYYDIYISLNSISNSRANLTVKSVYELMEQEIIDDETIANKAKEKVGGVVENLKEGKISTIVWIVVLIIIIILVGFVIYKYKKNQISFLKK